MRIGIIVESAPGGPDMQVCSHVALQLRPEAKIEVSTLINKRRLIEECGAQAASLLEISQCDRIIIVWDLRPPWKEDGGQPCRHEDCEQILQSLRDAGADLGRVHLVCIEAMLEAWLLADRRAITSVISEITGRPCRCVPNTPNPQHIPDPKDRLDRFFRDRNARSYIHHMHAIKIARAWPNLDAVRNIDTFQRFERFVTG